MHEGDVKLADDNFHKSKIKKKVFKHFFNFEKLNTVDRPLKFLKIKLKMFKVVLSSV
jgi:hypothetical protein